MFHAYDGSCGNHIIIAFEFWSGNEIEDSLSMSLLFNCEISRVFKRFVSFVPVGSLRQIDNEILINGCFLHFIIPNRTVEFDYLIGRYCMRAHTDFEPFLGANKISHNQLLLQNALFMGFQREKKEILKKKLFMAIFFYDFCEDIIDRKKT